jgi:alanyl-tRNA synthetase
MGLERMAQILQSVANNYETDLIFPLSKPLLNSLELTTPRARKTKVSLKVIGDHIRAVVHMIADGITASNTGRGYVLRRLIRRVVRHGRLIGIQGEFTTQVAETAIALSETAYPNVREREAVIKAELQREEASFLKTLEQGEKRLAEILERLAQQAKSQMEGRDAFILYDTYGFPLELTQEIAAEHELTVDLAGFEAAMEEQIQRSREAHQTIDLTAPDILNQLESGINSTQFLGYTLPSSPVQVLTIIANGKQVELAEAGAEVQVMLDQTPFYAESGGQVADRGYLAGDSVLVRIEDVQQNLGSTSTTVASSVASCDWETP